MRVWRLSTLALRRRELLSLQIRKQIKVVNARALDLYKSFCYRRFLLKRLVQVPELLFGGRCMRFWREEDSKIRREEREFQFEMFRITLAHDFLNSFSTVMIAVGISWIIAMLTLAYLPEIPVETKVSVVSSAWNMFIVWVIAISIFLVVSFWYIQTKQVGKLRKRYLPWKEEKTLEG